MTELERLLIDELKKRERQFISELNKFTTQYENNLEKIEKQYRKILIEQASIIDRQIQTFKKYETFPTKLQVNLEQEPLEQLNEQMNNLQISIANLAKEYSKLVDGLEILQKKLE